MLVMSLVPPLAAIFGMLILRDTMTFFQVIAMIITITGIVIVVYSRRKAKAVEGDGKIELLQKLKGFMLAFGGALGQAGGLVLSKKGMAGYDAFESSQVRIFAGVIGYFLIISFFGLWRKTLDGLKNHFVIAAVSFGSLVGPFIGVSFSLVALKYTSSGVAATLTSLALVLIIYPSLIINKEKIKIFEIIGSLIAVIGVGIFFI